MLCENEMQKSGFFYLRCWENNTGQHSCRIQVCNIIFSLLILVYIVKSKRVEIGKTKIRNLCINTEKIHFIIFYIDVKTNR